MATLGWVVLITGIIINGAMPLSAGYCLVEVLSVKKELWWKGGVLTTMGPVVTGCTTPVWRIRREVVKIKYREHFRTFLN